MVIDFTDEHVRLEQTQAKAETDALTGLANRRGLHRAFNRMPPSAPCGLLAVDLDNFKEANDHFGHAAGDAVLVEVSYRLRRAVRPEDLVVRMGGDEFAILVRGGEEVVIKIAERIVLELEMPIELSGQMAQVCGSVGATWSEAKPRLIDGLLAKADELLYEAKARGKNTFATSLL